VRQPRGDAHADRLARIRADVAREVLEFLQGMFESKFVLLLSGRRLILCAKNEMDAAF